jgi:hypothetical protein
MIPSAYADSKLYSVLPNNGDGDFTFNRDSSATRVGQNGLIQTSSYYGSELVDDFSTSYDYLVSGNDGNWGYYGTPLVCSTDANNKLTVTVNGNSEGIDLSNQITTIVGSRYRIRGDFTLTGANGAEEIRINLIPDGLVIGDIYVTGDSSIDKYFTATGTSLRLLITSNQYVDGYTFTVENLSVVEVLGDQPRLDYTDGSCPSLLLEPASTNLFTYSEDFSNAYWTKQSGLTCTYETTETLSPDGTYNASKLVGDGTKGIHNTTTSISGVVSRSVYLKSATGTVTVYLKDSSSLGLYVTVTEEWQRFTLIGDKGTSSQGIFVDDIPASGVYIWGAQLEQLSYATSYIPTSGSTITRTAETCNNAGNAATFNSTEGVLYVEMAALADSLTYRSLALSDGTTTNRVVLHYSNITNQINAIIQTPTTVANFLYTLSNEANINKIAIKWKVNDFALWVNGTEEVTDDGGSSFSSSTLDVLSFDDGGGGNPFYGKIKDVRVYKTALTDDQLTALTTL